MSNQSALATAEAALPVDLVEIRPGRSIAVHIRCRGLSGSPNQPPPENPPPRLFFVHGSCASMLQYRALIDHLSGAGHEVIAYDFLGCGRSSKPLSWSAYDFAELRSDLIAVIDRYSGGAGDDSTRTKNVLVCHSAGCSLGIGVAARGAGAAYVDGMVLMGGPAGPYRAHPVFYLPVPILDRLQPTLSAGFESLALHPRTFEGSTEERKEALALAKDTNGSNPMSMCKAYYRQMVLPPRRRAARGRAGGQYLPHSRRLRQTRPS